MKESVTGCTHCGVCTENCEFLKKYDLTIGDTEKLSKMAYHCFLCGKCSKVCPQGIDGREIVLQIRRHRVKEAGGRIPEKGYGMLLWEKEDYKFCRYTGTGKTALFFGCNFPSFYPETTRYLGKLLAEKADAFSVFDCCGKPVAELGLEEKETVILERLNKKLLVAGAGADFLFRWSAFMKNYRNWGWETGSWKSRIFSFHVRTVKRENF